MCKAVATFQFGRPRSSFHHVEACISSVYAVVALINRECSLSSRVQVKKSLGAGLVDNRVDDSAEAKKDRVFSLVGFFRSLAALLLQRKQTPSRGRRQPTLFGAAKQQGRGPLVAVLPQPLVTVSSTVWDKIKKYLWYMRMSMGLSL